MMRTIPRPWSVIRAATCVVLVMGSMAAAGPPASCESELPGLGVQLLEAPVALADDPRARSSIIDDLAPGATVERRLRFGNGSADQRLPVQVYATAATIEGGEFRAADGRESNELTGWIALSDDELLLEPCSGQEVTVQIAVPGDAAGGERYALIAAEYTPQAEDGAIVVASRIGIRAYLQVDGEGGSPDLAVDTIRPGRDTAGNPTVTVDISNPGGRALDVTGEIELSDGPGGLRAGPFPTTGATTLAPGDEGEVGITLDQSLPNGPWRAQVTLRSGLLEVTSQAEITFPEAGEGEAVPLSPLQDRGVLLPIALGLLLLALILLLIAWRRMRDRDQEEGRGPETPSGAPTSEAPVAGIGV